MTTMDQRTAALKLANHIRLAQANVLRTIREKADRKQSWAHAAEVMGTLPADCASLRVARLLGACHGMGPRAVRIVLRAGDVGESARLGSVTERQRAAMTAVLMSGTTAKGAGEKLLAKPKTKPKPRPTLAPVSRPTWGTARYADIDKVADWLEAESRPFAAKQMRARTSGRITWQALDNKLTSIGLCFEHMPDSVWVVEDPIGDYRAKKRERRAA